MDNIVYNLFLPSTFKHHSLTTTMSDEELLIRMLERAKTLLAQQFPPLRIHEKSAKELVTETDLAIERALRVMIHTHRPQHAILGEEEGNTQGNEHLWIIDPLDGTTNYVHSIPYFCSAIALTTRRAPQLAGVTTLSHTFHATTTQAYMDNRVLRTPQPPEIEQAFVAFCHKNTPKSIREISTRYEQFKTTTRDFRRLGSANLELCMVASGALHAFIGHDLPPWDFTAGCMIAQQAGCTVTALDGGPWTRPGVTGVLAAHPALHAQLLALWTQTRH